MQHNLRYIPGKGVKGKIWFKGCLFEGCKTRKVHLDLVKADRYGRTRERLVSLAVKPGLEPYQVNGLFQVPDTSVELLEVHFYNGDTSHSTDNLQVEMRKWLFIE